VYDLSLVPLTSITLRGPTPVQPSAFAVTDAAIYVCDHAKGVIVAYDRSGAYVDSYGTLPNGETRLSPLTLTHFGGVIYVADIALRRILAISVADAPGITERGELILTIPGDRDQELGFPSAVHVTPDGRLLVGDAESGVIRVFTCDGREMYGFEAVPGQTVLSPQGIARDDRMDPSLQDDSSFDPSGLRAAGRFHVLDSSSGRVHVFNPLGRYVTSYPEPGELQRPASIAIDRAGARVFVADPPSCQIHIFGTGQG
jgi:sugar lactone lactonase YvrE